MLLSVASLHSCNDRKDRNILTYKINRAGYTEKLSIPGTIQAVSNVLVTAPRVMFGQMIIKKLAGDGTYVRKGDTLCVLSVPELESTYKDALRNIETLEAELEKTEADNNLDIAALQTQLEESDGQLKIVMLDSLKIRFETKANQELLRLQMKKALLEKQKIAKKLASAKMIGISDIRQKQARIMMEKTKAKSYADQLGSLILIARREGIISRMELPIMRFMSPSGAGSIGGRVREGGIIFGGANSAILQFPDLSRLQVSADASESDFKRIEKGQKVLLTVDAAKKLFTTGRVNRKSLSTSFEQRYSESKVRTYEVIIDIDSSYSKMTPGMSATCDVILKEVKDTLFIPTLAIFDRDSTKVVYVKNDKIFCPVSVATGISGSSYTIISGALKGDEEIALSQPPEFMIEKKQKAKRISDTIPKK